MRKTFLMVLGRQPKGKCIAIFYHGIPSKKRQAFARQMDILLRLAKPVPADFNGEISKDTLYVIITMDDAFESQYKNALPELKSRRIPATIFVPTGYIGKTPDWSAAMRRLSRKEKVLSAEMIQTIDSDLITFGSHTVSHPDLTRMPISQVDYELKESRRMLEEILGHPVTMISFPHGCHNPALLERARAVGYDRAFLITPSLSLTKGPEFALGRVEVSPTDWAIEFRLKISGMYTWLPLVQRTKSRLKEKVLRLLGKQMISRFSNRQKKPGA